MSLVKWTDNKKHYQDEHFNSSDVRLGSTSVAVHHHIYFEPEQWVLTMYLGGNPHMIPLESTTLEEAKKEGLEIFKAKILAISKDVAELEVTMGDEFFNKKVSL